ncbi:MAG: amidase [Frankiaceae bacterium]|nr:amidase [Frankiaceae bacterium]
MRGEPLRIRIRLLAGALLLALPALPAATSAAAAPRECSRTVGGIDVERATVLDIQRAMVARRLTSAALIRTYLARIEAFDHGPGEMNAIRALNPHALAQAGALTARGSWRSPRPTPPAKTYTARHAVFR